jgi:hypothetical protein
MHNLLDNNMQSLIIKKFISNFSEEVHTESFDDETYYNFPQNGISFLTNGKQSIITIQLFSGEKDEYLMYQGELPHDLAFNLSRNEVRQRLGDPKSHGGGDLIPALGLSPHWDSYRMKNHVLHIEYTEKNMSIALISLMTFEASPL